MDIAKLQLLPVDQKIEIIGKLWDDIDDSNSPIVLSPAVLAEIDRRRKQIAENPEIAIGRDEMWRQVNQSQHRDG